MGRSEADGKHKNTWQKKHYNSH